MTKKQDYKPITEDDFKQAVGRILLQPPKVKSENKRPSKDDMAKRYKFTRAKE